MSTTDPTTMQQLMAVVLSSRPPGWCFGPILFGIGLIHSRSMLFDTPSLLTAGAQVPRGRDQAFIVVFGMNDVYDWDSDIRNPRKIAAGLEGSVLSPVFHPSVRLAACLSTLLIFAASLATQKLQNILATTLILFLGWQYSAPPLRLKGVPLLDSLSNGTIVFLAWFIGYSFGGGMLSNAPDKGYLILLCTSGVHALGAVIDVESDMAAGQMTIATFFGQRYAAAFGALAFVASSLLVGASNSIFIVYLWGGSAIMLLPCLHLAWAHYAFKTIVFWTVGMALVWFALKALAHPTSQ